MLNPFKKRKTSEAKPAKPEAPKPAAAAHQAPRPKETPLDKARDKRRIMGVITNPHLTEKTSAASAKRWYTFRVRRDASKALIRQAVGDRYGVGVELVRILRKRSKKMRLGRIQGRSPGFKKAMVKVKEGQSIEFT